MPQSLESLTLISYGNEWPVVTVLRELTVSIGNRVLYTRFDFFFLFLMLIPFHVICIVSCVYRVRSVWFQV